MKLDRLYQDFIGLVRNQIATAIANARVYEQERRRADESTAMIPVIPLSAQVQEQARLAEWEERYRGIVNQSVGAIAEADSTGLFTTVNDHFCQMTGYTRQELLNLRMLDLTHPKDLARSKELLEKLNGERGTSVDSTPAPTETKEAPKVFSKLVQDIMEKDNLDTAAATKLAAKQNPDLFAAYRQAVAR